MNTTAIAAALRQLAAAIESEPALVLNAMTKNLIAAHTSMSPQADTFDSGLPLDEPPDYEPFSLAGAAAPAAEAALSRCPYHDTPWEIRPAGVSKAGKPYQAFWKCDGKETDGSYCKRKPVKAWADSHMAA